VGVAVIMGKVLKLDPFAGVGDDAGKGGLLVVS